MRRNVFVILILAGACACGGIAESHSDRSGPTASEPAAASPNPDPSNSQAPPSKPSGSNFGTTDELANCVLGYRLEEDPESCHWLTDGRCYETKAAACACACPVDKTSVCSSGFDQGPGGQTQVFCY